MSDDGDDKKALVNVNDLAGINGPGKELISQICGGVKGAFGPWQTIRMAKAEAEANEIKAESDGKIAQKNHENQLQIERAKERIGREYIEDQENIERIVISAAPKVNEDANINDMNPDFKRYFTENARLISDEKMQEIWADILAGEANSPGSFSKKTLSILKDLEKKDAELFENLGTFNCHIVENKVMPAVYEFWGSMYLDRNINYDNLVDLSNLGLIEINSIGLHNNFKIPIFHFIYYDKFILFKASENIKHVKIGFCLYTRAGKELTKICSSQKKEDFLEYIIERIKSDGHEMIEQYNKDTISSEYREKLKEIGIDF